MTPDAACSSQWGDGIYPHTVKTVARDSLTRANIGRRGEYRCTSRNDFRPRDPRETKFGDSGYRTQQRWAPW
jgi:hypothetical protein